MTNKYTKLEKIKKKEEVSYSQTNKSKKIYISDIYTVLSMHTITQRSHFYLMEDSCCSYH